MKRRGGIPRRRRWRIPGVLDTCKCTLSLEVRRGRREGEERDRRRSVATSRGVDRIHTKVETSKMITARKHGTGGAHWPHRWWPRRSPCRPMRWQKTRPRSKAIQMSPNKCTWTSTSVNNQQEESSWDCTGIWCRKQRRISPHSHLETPKSDTKDLSFIASYQDSSCRCVQRIVRSLGGENAGRDHES